MENWQARVVEEQQLLNGKIERLENTIFDPEKIKKIEVDQLPLLKVQLQAMKTYSLILLERISKF